MFEHFIYDLKRVVHGRLCLLRAVTCYICLRWRPSRPTTTATPRCSGWTPDDRQNVQQPSTLTSSLRCPPSSSAVAALHCGCESSCFRHQHSPDLASASRNLSAGRFLTILINQRRYSLNLGCCLLLVKDQVSMDGRTIIEGEEVTK